MTFGKNLTAAIEKKGLTHDQVAEALDVSRVAVGQWANDKTMPRGDKILALAELLGVTPNDLYLGPAPKAAEEASTYNVTRRAVVLDELLSGLPDSEIDEIIRSLKEKKSRYDALIEELLKKRRA
jgi:transcriptional regulator with XRE-family HTH domain